MTVPATYTDRNQVTWTIVTADKGSTIFATTDGTEGVGYGEERQDVGPIHAQSGDAVGELEWRALTQAIDAFAGQHAGRVLVVKATRPFPWWLFALALVALTKRR